MLKCFCGEYLRQKGNSLSINRLHGIIRREVQKVSYLLAANKRSSLLKDLPSLGSTIYVDTLFSITIAYYDTGVKGIMLLETAFRRIYCLLTLTVYQTLILNILAYRKAIIMGIFTGKTLLITGGTGSFGHAVMDRFLSTDIGEIRIFSRDEKKQDDMRHEYQAKMPEVAEKIKFYIGDVRDINSVKNAMNGVDYIFHAAALKQVPSCEFFPIEAVKTNVLGTENVLNAAIEAGVKSIICLSTDKAAYPVNAMGTSKAMMEKVIVAKSRTVDQSKTKICCTRYGNVMCSRGSVIPLWIDQIRAGNPITVTEPTMTRFIMSLEEAVDLVLFAFENGETGDILVQKAPACTIKVQAEAVCDLFNGDKGAIRQIGIRHGEKMYETLLTNEECERAIDLGKFYRVPCDSRNLNYDKYFTQGNIERAKLTEFNSNNTELLDVEEVKVKLMELSYIKEELEK